METGVGVPAAPQPMRLLAISSRQKMARGQWQSLESLVFADLSFMNCASTSLSGTTPPPHMDIGHLPIQNLLKIVSSRSSLAVWPVISPRA